MHCVINVGLLKNKIKKNDYWSCNESEFFNLDLFELFLSRNNSYLLNFMDGYRYLYIDTIDNDFIKFYGKLFSKIRTK